MRRVIYLRIADRDVHLPRLIGAFVLAAAVLMFFQASFAMVDSWNTVKYYGSCIDSLSSIPDVSDQRAQFTFCSDALYRATGVVVRGDRPVLTLAQFWGAILSPIANLLFWLAALMFGYLVYKSGDLVLPIEERITEVSEPRTPGQTFRKKRK